MRRLFLKLFRRRRLERDLETELAFHRAMSADHGNPVPFGNVAVLKESALDLWRFAWIENLWRDAVYGVRSLRRSPTLVLTALVSLGLGIGANTAIFSIAMEFLFISPSVTDQRTLVGLTLGGSSHSHKDVLEFVRASGLFQDVAGENEESYINWDNGTETRRVFCNYTSKNYFSMLGVPMALGRGVLPSDPNEVVVLSDRFWRKNFQSDPKVIGRTVNLDGKAYTVVGVLPRNHRSLIGFGYSADLYAPRYLDETMLALYARLKPGTTLAQAGAALVEVARRLDVTMPKPFKYAQETRVTPLAGFARMKGEMLTIGLFFLLLLLLVGLVLLIACVNVASLLLARASARGREIAIRLSLGASRSRLFQQLLVESLLLALLGAGCGLALAQFLDMSLARIQLPVPIPIRLQFELDWRAGLYAALLTSFATMACGLLPAWHSVKEAIASNLRSAGKLRLRQTLVVAQIALSLVVLAAASLFLRNLLKSNALSPGFDVTHTLRAEVNLPPVAYRETQRKNAFVAEALEALQALPGIEAVAAARIVPFTDGTRFSTNFTFTDTGERVRTYFYWNAVSPEYFRVMNIPIVRGRTFSGSAEAAAHPVIVNRNFVDRYLGQREAVGRTFLWGDGKAPYTIIAVVEGTKNMTIGENDLAQVYEDLSRIDNDRTQLQFVLRSAAPPVVQLQAVREVLRQVEPGAGLEIATLYSSIGLAFLPSQIGAVLLGSIGLLALLLATIGLYGVMVYSVQRRNREIAVRVALGARQSQISRMVLSDAAKLLGAGSLIGLFIAVFVTRPLAMFLVPGLKSNDPLSFAGVLLVLGVTGMLAAWGPVRRAVRVDPMRVLRYD